MRTISGQSGAARQKLRDLELKAGHKPARGQKGTAHVYNLKRQRDQERRWVEQAEAAYTRFVAGWNARGPKARTGAAKEERQQELAAELSPRCPALRHAVIRARRQITKEQGPGIAKRGARASDGQDQAVSGGGFRPVLTTPARDALKQDTPGRRNRSPLPNKETACRSHQWIAAG